MISSRQLDQVGWSDPVVHEQGAPRLFYLRYLVSELRRRKGRTLLTALGLGVGVGLVVTVTALSTGIDRAQAKVLKPLTGVGTDMSVSRPISIPTSSSNGGPGFPRLSEKERQELQKENGGARLGLRNLGKPGSHFTRDSFLSTSQLSFPASEVKTVSRIANVEFGCLYSAIFFARSSPTPGISRTVPCRTRTSTFPVRLSRLAAARRYARTRKGFADWISSRSAI